MAIQEIKGEIATKVFPKIHEIYSVFKKNLKIFSINVNERHYYCIKKKGWISLYHVYSNYSYNALMTLKPATI